MFSARWKEQNLKSLCETFCHTS